MVHSPPVQLPPTLRLTHEQYGEMVKVNPDLCIEQDAEGKIIVMPPTGSEGGNRNAEFLINLGIWNRRTGLGKVFDSSTGFRLSNGATRSPDAAWVSNEQWAAISPDLRKQFAPVCPGFVMELASESDDLVALRQKMQEYLDNGSRLGWLILPNDQCVEIYRADVPVELKAFDQTLSGEDILPGFRLNLSAIFNAESEPN